MCKKLFSLTLLLGAFVFICSTAQAQLNFYNGSNCTIQVKAAAENPNNPCGPTCTTNTITIGPFSTGTLNVGPTCFFAATAYRAVKFSSGLVGASADKCTGPNPASFVDCQGTPRVLHILSNNFAAIY